MNVGSKDKKIRIAVGLLAIAFALISFSGSASPLVWVLLVVGLILIGTGVINFCPAYKLFGITTRK